MARITALPLFLLLAISCCCGAFVTVTARPTPSTATTTAAASTATGGGFITSWCAGTDYPSLCNATLAPHAAEVGASPARLSLAALTATLDGARKAAAAMKAMSVGASSSSSSRHVAPSSSVEAAAQDCVSMLEDAEDLLRQSVDAMGRLGKEEETGTSSSSRSRSRSVTRFQVNSVETWTSAALTNEDMCVEGFRGQAPDVREAVRGNVAGVVHLTANALAIVNAMAKQIQ